MTSDVFALATAVLFQSPVQHFALAPNNLTDAPAWAIDFMKSVPTTWDDIEFIDGYPGRYVVVARRNGDKWYIAGVNAQDAPCELSLELPMLDREQPVMMYTDDMTLNGTAKEMKLNKKKPLKVSIPSKGGLVVVGNAK